MTRQEGTKQDSGGPPQQCDEADTLFITAACSGKWQALWLPKCRLSAFSHSFIHSLLLVCPIPCAGLGAGASKSGGLTLSSSQELCGTGDRPMAKNSLMDVLRGWTLPFCLERGRARSWNTEVMSQMSHKRLFWSFWIG